MQRRLGQSITLSFILYATFLYIAFFYFLLCPFFFFSSVWLTLLICVHVHSLLMETEARRIELETQKLMELQLAEQARAEAERAMVRASWAVRMCYSL